MSQSKSTLLTCKLCECTLWNLSRNPSLLKGSECICCRKLLFDDFQRLRPNLKVMNIDRTNDRNSVCFIFILLAQLDKYKRFPSPIGHNSKTIVCVTLCFDLCFPFLNWIVDFFSCLNTTSYNNLRWFIPKDFLVLHGEGPTPKIQQNQKPSYR